MSSRKGKQLKKVQQKKRKVIAADLFCGAGGTSTGLKLACDALGVDLDLVAVNHWPNAIEVHSQNHPAAIHACTSVDDVDPLTLVPGAKLDILLASPDCTHHSNAAGGRPRNEQSRATAWCVTKWIHRLQSKGGYIKVIVIENVKEFMNWGGLDAKGQPLKKQKGATFMAFINALISYGYKVEYKVLNAADYDNPTSRERLFIIATRTKKGITWPEPTNMPLAKLKEANGKSKSPTLFDVSPKQLKPYRTAREIIDWDIPSKSIYTREKPLSPNTLSRIYAGLRKFSGLPFIVPQLSGGVNRSVDSPLPTITTTSRGIGLCEPFLVLLRGGQDADSLDNPLKTITTKGAHHALVEPFIVALRSHNTAKNVNDEPLDAITAGGNHHGLCEAFLINAGGPEIAPRSVNDPYPTVLTRDHLALVEPFLVGAGGPTGSGRPKSIDQPLGTVLPDPHMALVEPFIIPVNHGNADGRHHQLGSPMPTITTVDAWGLIQPYLVKYYGTDDAEEIDKPLGTVTTRDRFGLVEPEWKLAEGDQLFFLDIHFRMLQPHELAAAMSFPKSYSFAGQTRENKVRMIGNAVAVNLARALCHTVLTNIL